MLYTTSEPGLLVPAYKSGIQLPGIMHMFFVTHALNPKCMVLMHSMFLAEELQPYCPIGVACYHRM